MADFYDVYVEFGKSIHRGKYPKRKDYLKAFLKYRDSKKDKIYKLYITALQAQVITQCYHIEYAVYGSTAIRKKITAIRAKNRANFIRMGLVKRGDKTEIHHKDGNSMNNKRSNLMVVTKCQHKKLHGKKCN
jgi:hypothetical protein